MDAAYLGSGNRICTVVFVDLVRYAEEPVSKQAELKARFDALLATALEQTPAADRLVLDTGDGAALCFLGDPEDALFAANSLRSGVLDSPEPGLQLRVGVNLGPVRVVKDINGHSNVIGDGINVAQRVMSFAAPNQILVSRSYYEVVSRLSPDYAQLFSYVGLHKDKHVREHEVYEVQLSPHEAAKPMDVAPVPEPPASAGTGQAPRFDPEFLRRLTAALAREIGPVAPLIVRKAAERATDAAMLCEEAIQSVPSSHRPAFRAALANLGGGPLPPPSTAPPEPAPAKPLAPAHEIGAALLARAEHMLSRQIGPLARVLVREAAKHAATPRELFERLAVHIDDEKVRKTFLDEANRPA